jgi:L-asparaginase II
VAVLDAGGALVANAGDPYGHVFPRSSNKPMQAVAMLRAGLVPVDDGDLALVAGSHSGEPSHVARVRDMLGSAQLDEQALLCPPDLPMDAAAAHDVIRAGGGPARVYMNCSGKHAGMLLTCIAAGWSTVDYVDPGHPLQRACRAAVEEFTREPVQAVGVDGCGAPVFSASLAGLARAFLSFVDADPSRPEGWVAKAMRANPELMSGTGREDALLLRAVPGLLTKSGAEGVAVAAVPGLGAVAVKIDDGAARARMPVLAAGLAHLGVTGNALDKAASTAVFGGGRPVGEVRAIDAVRAC